MKINVNKADYTLSAAKPDQLPEEGLWEIALVGRSNVGKSSFINCMLNRKNLARTSSQPGKTRQLNYYRIDETFYFVDLPGYGYAKVSSRERMAWQKMMKNYLKVRNQLLMVLLLVDFRHQPSSQDQAMREYLDDCQLPYFVIATKADKVKKGQWARKTADIRQTLDLVTEDQILPFSAVSREGRDEAWEILENELEDAEAFE